MEDKQVRISAGTLGLIWLEQNPRESYSDCIRRLIEELNRLRTAHDPDGERATQWGARQ